MTERIRVVLIGAAAGDAQHLYAALRDEGLPVSSTQEGSDETRSIEEVLLGGGVGLIVNATYDVVASAVRRWLANRGHAAESVSVEPDPPPDREGSSEADGHQT